MKGWARAELNQGRAGGSAGRGRVRETERRSCEAGGLPWDRDSGERNINMGGSQARNELELEGDRDG